MKQRLDVRVVEDGGAPTRNRAQALIMAGKVEVNGRVERKSGFLVSTEDRVRVTEALPFVSRGGYKLNRALAVFSLDPEGWRVIDLGASTGGFTDCWLQHGAREVYAVDVGYGQLDWKLRQDPRVVVKERTNARYLTAEVLGTDEPFQGASIDASFIGLKLLLPPLKPLMTREGSIVALVKPQFEAGPDKLGRGGVVRRPEVHEEVLHRVTTEAAAMGFTIRGLDVSPIRGPEGNIEFLLHLGMAGSDAVPLDIAAVVQRAWQMGDANA